MNICIPVNENSGLQSSVCVHFGSAPFFMLVDTDSGSCRALVNKNQHHGHGMCAPLAALEDERIDGIVVAGIGMGALNKLNAARIGVYFSEHGTVAETLAAYKSGSLRIMQPGMTCAGHGHHHP